MMMMTTMMMVALMMVDLVDTGHGDITHYTKLLLLLKLTLMRFCHLQTTVLVEWFTTQLVKFLTQFATQKHQNWLAGWLADWLLLNNGECSDSQII